MNLFLLGWFFGKRFQQDKTTLWGIEPHIKTCLWQGCIFRLTCSHPELTEDYVLTSAYVKIFKTVTRNAVNKSVWKKKDCSWLPLNKHAMNISIQTSTNVSLSTVLQEPEHGFLRIRAHLKLKNRKTSPCSPCAPNLLHVLVSRILGYHKLCSPDQTTEK